MTEKSATQELARLADRIFFSAVIGQVLLILVMFLLGLSIFAWNEDRGASHKIKSNFAEWASPITEAVYLNSKTESFELKNLPVLRDFENSLKINGVQTATRVGDCDRSIEGEQMFELRIGEFRLDQCFYVRRVDTFALKTVLFGFLLAILSLVLAVGGWVLWRGRFKSSVLDPIVQTVEGEVREAAVGKMASQIAHDIRSPLAALNIFMKELHGLPEEKRILLRSAVNRIQDIANNILPADKRPRSLVPADQPNAKRVELLTNLVESIVSEKRLQYRDLVDVEINLKLEQQSYGAFSSIVPIDFQRVLSNLIDNAVESLADSRGRVAVLIDNLKSEIRLCVVDTGRGIPSEILPKLMVKGASFNKVGGSGLGLAHARSTIEAWGGRITIESREGFGTKVALHLKPAPAPQWFLESIHLRPKMRIAVVDDDASIHQIWLGRIQSAAPQLHLGADMIRFSSLQEAENFFSDRGWDCADLFLIDYEFMGSSENGLSWIMKNQIVDRSVLVTSRFEELSIRKICDRMGIRLLPKSLSPYVPMVVEGVEMRDHSEDTWVRAFPRS